MRPVGSRSKVKGTQWMLSNRINSGVGIHSPPDRVFAVSFFMLSFYWNSILFCVSIFYVLIPSYYCLIVNESITAPKKRSIKPFSCKNSWDCNLRKGKNWFRVIFIRWPLNTHCELGRRSDLSCEDFISNIYVHFIETKRGAKNQAKNSRRMNIDHIEKD